MSARRTLGADLPTVGENTNLTGDVACRRVVIRTRLNSRHDLDIALARTVKRHATVVAAIDRDSRRSRDGVGAHVTHTRSVIVPVALTAITPALSAIAGLGGDSGGDKKDR